MLIMLQSLVNVSAQNSIPSNCYKTLELRCSKKNVELLRTILTHGSN